MRAIPWTAVGSLASLIIAPAASAQTAPAPRCAAPEYRQLDFWVGDWALEFDKPDGETGVATNEITNDEFGSCVVVERFSMPNGYVGSSYSIYDPNAGLWRQTWVDNQGGVFVLTGGPVADRGHVFEFVTTTPVGSDPRIHRMIWEDVAADSLVWRWQSRADDGGWEDKWVLRYRRAPGA